jgi:hypothetical protein
MTSKAWAVVMTSFLVVVLVVGGVLYTRTDTRLTETLNRLSDTQKDKVATEAILAETEGELAAVSDNLSDALSHVVSLSQANAELWRDNNILAESKVNLEQTNDELSRETKRLDNLLVETEKTIQALQSKFPLKDFGSVSQLTVWAQDHMRASSSSTEGWYSSALAAQTDAANDGYYVSANIESNADGTKFYVTCMAICGGDIYWWDPEHGNFYGEWQLFPYPLSRVQR